MTAISWRPRNTGVSAVSGTILSPIDPVRSAQPRRQGAGRGMEDGRAGLFRRMAAVSSEPIAPSALSSKHHGDLFGWRPSLVADTALPGSGGVEWKEEVLFPDGRRMVVERSQVRGGRHAVGQELPVKSQKIQFVMPDKNEDITWKSDYSEAAGQVALRPIGVYIVEKIPYIVATATSCGSYNEWKRPNPPYVIFKYGKNGWMNISISDLPANIESPNLILATYESRDSNIKIKSGFISADEVAKINELVSFPQYRRIIRQPMKPEMCD